MREEKSRSTSFRKEPRNEKKERKKERRKKWWWSKVETRIVRNIPTYLSFRVHIVGRMVDAGDGWTRPVSNKVSVQTKLESGRAGTRIIWTVVARVWSLVCEVRPRASRIYGPNVMTLTYRLPSREGPKADLSQRVSKPRPGRRLPQPERSSSLRSTVESPPING